MTKIQRGQASIEYLVVCGAIVAALFTPITNDQNVMQICIEALRHWYSAFSFAKSLPTLPF
ncbi:hypothetical protein [Shewanella sp.]|uniref:hypothetical protein n=1 Tax=Shewanella sp. TaxID=50422 RepID=UPI003A97B79F